MADEKEYIDVSRLGAVAYTRPDGSNDYQNGFEDGVSFILDKVDNFPREKAVPVVKGHWIWQNVLFNPVCSVCKRFADSENKTPFCAYCGAKMDEKENEK